MKQLDLDAREQMLNEREKEVFQKESNINLKNQQILDERQKLEQWRKTIQEEDERAQINIANAAKMLEEVKKLESQVLGYRIVSLVVIQNHLNSAVAAAELENRERTESGIGSRTGSGSGSRTGGSENNVGATSYSSPQLSSLAKPTESESFPV